MPDAEADKAKQAEYLARGLAQGYFSETGAAVALAQLRLLYPFCRPDLDHYNLHLFVEPGRTKELPKGVKYSAWYIEEVFSDGTAKVVKTMYDAMQGQIIPRTRERLFKPVPARTAWERLLEDD